MKSMMRDGLQDVFGLFKESAFLTAYVFLTFFSAHEHCWRYSINVWIILSQITHKSCACYVPSILGWQAIRKALNDTSLISVPFDWSLELHARFNNSIVSTAEYCPSTVVLSVSFHFKVLSSSSTKKPSTFSCFAMVRVVYEPGISFWCYSFAMLLFDASFNYSIIEGMTTLRTRSAD